MASIKKGLGSKGKGLEALINTKMMSYNENDLEYEGILEIDINKIEANTGSGITQPRPGRKYGRNKNRSDTNAGTNPHGRLDSHDAAISGNQKAVCGLHFILSAGRFL